MAHRRGLAASVCVLPSFVKHRFSVLGEGAPVLDLAERVPNLDAQAISFGLCFSELRLVAVRLASDRCQLVALRHRVPALESVSSKLSTRSNHRRAQFRTAVHPC